MALLICCSWGKWLLMTGLKWRVENTSPGANTPGLAGYTPTRSLAPQSYLSEVELHGFPGIQLKESDRLPHLLFPDPGLGVRNLGCLFKIPDFHSDASILMALLLVGRIGKQLLAFVNNRDLGGVTSAKFRRHIWF